MINEREKELKRIIAISQKELHKLKGKQITLCGYCWHSDEGNRDEHIKNSPHCHETAYPCPVKIYARGVTFEEDGRAKIDWKLQ